MDNTDVRAGHSVVNRIAFISIRYIYVDFLFIQVLLSGLADESFNPVNIENRDIFSLQTDSDRQTDKQINGTNCSVS